MERVYSLSGKVATGRDGSLVIGLMITWLDIWIAGYPHSELGDESFAELVNVNAFAGDYALRKEI